VKNNAILLSLGLLALAFVALPAIASAGEPQLDPSNGKFPLPFTIANGHSEWRAANEPAFTCTSSFGAGEYTSSTTGKTSLTFSGCSTSFFGFPVSCNSGGASSGVIKTNSSVFHNTYLTDGKTTPGILVTPPIGGVFTTIICGSFARTELTGNGLIGHLEAPKCGGKSRTATLNFTATGASQTFQQVTATGTSYS
jgi:hypothetical protein